MDWILSNNSNSSRSSARVSSSMLWCRRPGCSAGFRRVGIIGVPLIGNVLNVKRQIPPSVRLVVAIGPCYQVKTSCSDIGDGQYPHSVVVLPESTRPVRYNYDFWRPSERPGGKFTCAANGCPREGWQFGFAGAPQESTWITSATTLACTPATSRCSASVCCFSNAISRRREVLVC